MADFSRVFPAAFLALALVTQAGFAHSSKEGTTPPDGEVLSTSPESIGMTFDMPMRVTMISLTDQDGTEHDLTRQDNMQPVTVFNAKPQALGIGKYKVEWRGLAEDGHAMQGTFSFEVTD